MRIGTCLYQSQQYLFVKQSRAIAIPALDPKFDQPEYCDVLRLIAAGPDCWGDLAERLESVSLKAQVKQHEIELLAPIPKPPKDIMCVSGNYEDTIAEFAAMSKWQADPPEQPIVFTKSVSSVAGPQSDFLFDSSISREIDWECELAVVIGVGGKHIQEEDALKHVFGYTVINDITARDLQFAYEQYFIGKSLDGACPMGPWIVTTDEIPDPQTLNLRCRVNGQVKQASNTSHQIFSVASVIATLSMGMTLEPGDIISTGSPAGVGFARKPPEFLRPGDLVECEIAGIGQLQNNVVDVGQRNT